MHNRSVLRLTADARILHGADFETYLDAARTFTHNALHREASHMASQTVAPELRKAFGGGVDRVGR